MTICNHHNVQCDACYRVSLSLAKRIGELEDDLEQAQALSRYCGECHSAPGEKCTDANNEPCFAHAGRMFEDE